MLPNPSLISTILGNRLSLSDTSFTTFSVTNEALLLSVKFPQYAFTATTVWLIGEYSIVSPVIVFIPNFSNSFLEY